MSKANYVNMILYDRFGLPCAMVEVMLTIDIKNYTPKQLDAFFFYPRHHKARPFAKHLHACTSLEPCVKGAKKHWNPLSQSSIVPIVSIISQHLMLDPKVTRSPIQHGRHLSPVLLSYTIKATPKRNNARVLKRYLPYKAKFRYIPNPLSCSTCVITTSIHTILCFTFWIFHQRFLDGWKDKFSCGILWTR